MSASIPLLMCSPVFVLRLNYVTFHVISEQLAVEISSYTLLLRIYAPFQPTTELSNMDEINCSCTDAPNGDDV